MVIGLTWAWFEIYLGFRVCASYVVWCFKAEKGRETGKQKSRREEKQRGKGTEKQTSIKSKKQRSKEAEKWETQKSRKAREAGQQEKAENQRSRENWKAAEWRSFARQRNTKAENTEKHFFQKANIDSSRDSRDSKPLHHSPSPSQRSACLFSQKAKRRRAK